jgi:hypothetical protein
VETAGRRELDETARLRGWPWHLMLSSGTIDSAIDIQQGAEPFIGRVFELPAATAEDFGLPGMRPEALRDASGWQEWLTEYTGGEAWAGDERVPETNFMARAAVGDTTNGYVKTGETRDGLDVWRRC